MDGPSVTTVPGSSKPIYFIVRWENLEDHSVGFRESNGLSWHGKKLLHHFYSPFPVVEHYSMKSEKLTFPDSCLSYVIPANSGNLNIDISGKSTNLFIKLLLNFMGKNNKHSLQKSGKKSLLKDIENKITETVKGFTKRSVIKN